VSEIRAAQLILFYLFDIAESIDLNAVPSLIGGPTEAARLQPKQPTPPYVQYDKPPLSFDGEVVGIGNLDGFRPRFRVYDYGVVAIALTKPFAGSWSDFAALGQTLMENADFEQRAEHLCRDVANRLRAACVSPRVAYLSEDYKVYAVHELDRPQAVDQLLADHGAEIAAMLRGERQLLSEQERQAVLQHRISYLADDVVIPTWNAAFVFDTPSGMAAAIEILEFANSQLLEFRHYDELLDTELVAIYSRLRQPQWYDQWISSRYTRAAREVHALFIDVNELTDRTENALKFIGDIYAVRVFSLVGDRLGLGRWKADVESKLKTLDDIYRFAVEQSSMSRGQFLELTIVLILVFELVLIFLGVMQ
jgi:hypothetical protein